MKTLALLAALFALPAFAGNEYADKLDQDLGGAQKLLDDAQAGGQLATCYPNQDAAGIARSAAELRAMFAPDAKDFAIGADGWKAFLTRSAGGGDGTDSSFVCKASDQAKQTVEAFDKSMTSAEAKFKVYCDMSRDIAKKFDDSFSGHVLARMGSGCRDSSASVKAARKLIQDATAQACEHFFMNVSYAQDSAHASRKAFERGCEGLKEDEHDHEVELEHKSDRHQRYMDCYNAHGQVGWSCGDEN